MANTEMIRAYIRDSGYKLQYIARAMQISTTALNQKLQGRTQFKLDEAERLSTMLGLSMTERDACFFDQQNRAERLMQRAQENKRRAEHSDPRAEQGDPAGAATVRHPVLGTQPGGAQLARRH